MKVIATGGPCDVAALQNCHVRQFTRARVVTTLLSQSLRRDDAIIGTDGRNPIRGLAVELKAVLKYSILTNRPGSSTQGKLSRCREPRMLRPSQRFLVYGMPLPDISQLLDSKTLISSVSAIVGAIVGGLVTVLRNRVKTLEYTARHDRLAFAVNDARFGAVQVTWNGHNVVNLFSSRVEVENQTTRDLSDLRFKVYTGNETLLLSERPEMPGTAHAVGYTPEYAASLAAAPEAQPTEQQIQTFLHSREYLVPVLNRGQRVVFTYLTSVPGENQGPSVWVDLLHQGVRIQYRQIVPHVHGAPARAALLVGLLASAVTLALASLYISEPWAAGLICLTVGLVAQSIGAMLYRAGVFMKSLVLQ